MKIFKKITSKTLFSVTFILLFVISNSNAQSTTSPNSDMENFEKSLLKIIDDISISTDNYEKIELNKTLITKFQKVFMDPRSLSYPFDNLYAISDLKSASGNVRIFTWELQNDHDVNTYFGILSYKFDDEIYTLILTDSSQRISNAEFTSLNNNRWFGAIYYDIREYSFKNDKYVVLLGLNRSEDLIKKKVIEILDIGEEIKFGKEVFVFPKQTVGLKRKIYQYSVDADMSIWFEKDQDLILMDHLSPVKSMYNGKHEYYAPDLSFDALEYKKGKWVYRADYDAKMKKTDNDKYYEMELPKQKKIY